MGEPGRSDPLPLQQYRRLKYYIPLVMICFTTKKLDIIEVGIIRQELAKHPVLPIYAYLYHMELLFLGGSLALPVPPNKQQGSGVNLSSQKINRDKDVGCALLPRSNRTRHVKSSPSTRYIYTSCILAQEQLDFANFSPIYVLHVYMDV